MGDPDYMEASSAYMEASSALGAVSKPVTPKTAPREARYECAQSLQIRPLLCVAYTNDC